MTNTFCWWHFHHYSCTQSLRSVPYEYAAFCISKINIYKTKHTQHNSSVWSLASFDCLYGTIVMVIIMCHMNIAIVYAWILSHGGYLLNAIQNGVQRTSGTWSLNAKHATMQQCDWHIATIDLLHLPINKKQIKWIKTIWIANNVIKLCMTH